MYVIAIHTVLTETEAEFETHDSDVTRMIMCPDVAAVQAFFREWHSSAHSVSENWALFQLVQDKFYRRSVLFSKKQDYLIEFIS